MLLTIEEAAERLRVAPSTVRQLMHAQGFPCVRINARCVRIVAERLQPWLDAQLDDPDAPFHARSGGDLPA